ncbi:MAG: hypothetical protein E7467_04590 [Ruminococcaceae bacterium]|nr:hypothetical protein [Oscillospiraceae bacterium]
MSDKKRFDDLFDEKWDAAKSVDERLNRFAETEAMLRKRDEERENAPRQRRNPIPSHKPPIYEPKKSMGKETARRPSKPRKKQSNIKGLMILGALILTAVAIIVGIILIIVGIIKEDEEVSLPETEIITTTEQLVFDTQPMTDSVQELIARADALAASYDYDGALALLRDYGPNYAQNADIVQAQERYLELKTGLVRWEDTTTIPHLAFRALVVDPNRAFDGDENATHYNKTMTTVNEFRGILQQLYDNGYVLVSLRDLTKNTATDDQPMFEQGDIYLPDGKKPLVLSQEDANFDTYRIDGPDDDLLADAEGDGFACQLLVNENGELTSKYIEADGTVKYGAYDFVTILEEFVRAHPDFSYHGAKATLALTGNEGVFGFQTHPAWQTELGVEAYMEQVRQAQQVAATLKANGWSFAAQGYSKLSFADSDTDTLQSNMLKWDEQVASIVGNTDILIFPLSSDIGGVDYYSGAKFSMLYDLGYRYFCNTDTASHWVQLRSNYLRQARRIVDGAALANEPGVFSDLFTATAVLDPSRP